MWLSGVRGGEGPLSFEVQPHSTTIEWGCCFQGNPQTEVTGPAPSRLPRGRSRTGRIGGALVREWPQAQRQAGQEPWPAGPAGPQNQGRPQPEERA